MTLIIRGQQYADRRAAAAALGVSPAAVSMAKCRGRLDAVGSGHGGGQPARPVTIRGVGYPTIAAACRALGVKRSTFEDARKRGRLALLGTRAAQRMSRP